jgi:hypothetical protein
MIKVENEMLVLDSTFSKEDVQAIDEFVKINVDKERERIIQLLSNKGLELEKDVSWDDDASHIRYMFMLDILKLVRGY